MTVGQMMNQTQPPKIGKVADDVKELMKQGDAKKFPGQGRRSVKSLERQ